jgi:Permeases of the drug/metabolite transporter (DMT) superfamily
MNYERKKLDNFPLSHYHWQSFWLWRRNMSATGILLAIFCNLLWGTAIPMIKVSTKVFEFVPGPGSQLIFAGIRFFISGLMLISYTAIKEKRLVSIKRENRGTVALILLFGTVLEYGLQYPALPNIQSADGSIFSSLSGFFTVILAPLFFKDDRYTLRKIAGVLSGLAGVLLVSLKGTGISIALNGEFLLIVATLCFVISCFITKKLGDREKAVDITAYNLLIGGAALFLIGLLSGGKFGKITVLSICCLLYLSLVSAMAFSIWAYLLSKFKASNLGIFNLVNPVIGTILAATLVGEEFSAMKYAASLLLVGIGIVLINTKHVPKSNRRKIQA